MITNTKDWTSPARQIEAVVEVYSSTSATTYLKNTDYLKEFKIDRVGENGKFFGFGISQKLTLQLVDKDRELDITTDNSFKVLVNKVNSCPMFYTSEVKRDEKTKQLTITAYDKLEEASKHTFAELELEPPYTPRNVANAINNLLLGNPVSFLPAGSEALTSYPLGANYDGTETLREVLDDIAEITQTVYFIDNAKRIFFTSLVYSDLIGGDLYIRRSHFFEYTTGIAKKLTTIAHNTELGDNVSVTTGDPGEAQYIRENGFWQNRDDIDEALTNAITEVGGMELQPYNLTWRGNFGIQPGDLIMVENEDDSYNAHYIINDTITFNGGLKQVSSWSYEQKSETEHSNPSTLGDALKQTFARVDKQKQEIEMVSGEVSTIKITTDNIVSSVKTVDDSINNLTNEVQSKMSAEDVTITVNKVLEEGTEKVITSTGFTFDEKGLRISKVNSDLATEITENGLSIYNTNDEVLTVNNLGVKAEDLHATTFLIIGTKSRIEDYGNNRSACFWLG